MDNMLIGLRFEGKAPVGICSEYMKKIFAALTGRENVTFDRILFPYADTLLLSEDSRNGYFFGTHALMYGVDARTLARAVFSACGETTADGEDMLALLAPNAGKIECTRMAVADFLDLSGGSEESCEYIGDFASLLGGMVRPWNIREASRRLCSFCEQAARTDGVRLRGLHGGSVCADVEPVSAEAIIKLYAAKTGGNAIR